MSDTSVDTEQSTAIDDVDTETVIAQPTVVKPVEGGVDSVIDYQSFPANTMVSQLPDQEAVNAMVGTLWLLPGAADESHALTEAQMGVVVSYAQQNFEPETSYEDFVAALRKKFVRGKQKDWNIVSGIASETRQLTAHELMSDRQMDMLFDAIVPALQGRAPHWDPDIQTNISRLPQSTKTVLLNQAITASTKGEVTLFMRKFNGACGQPQRQRRGDTATSQANPAGAGKPAGGGEAW